MMNNTMNNTHSPAMKRASLHETLTSVAFFCFGPMTVLAMYLLAMLAR